MTMVSLIIVYKIHVHIKRVVLVSCGSWREGGREGGGGQFPCVVNIVQPKYVRGSFDFLV